MRHAYYETHVYVLLAYGKGAKKKALCLGEPPELRKKHRLSYYFSYPTPKHLRRTANALMNTLNYEDLRRFLKANVVPQSPL